MLPNSQTVSILVRILPITKSDNSVCSTLRRNVCHDVLISSSSSSSSLLLLLLLLRMLRMLSLGRWLAVLLAESVPLVDYVTTGPGSKHKSGKQVICGADISCPRKMKA